MPVCREEERRREAAAQAEPPSVHTFLNTVGRQKLANGNQSARRRPQVRSRTGGACSRFERKWAARRVQGGGRVSSVEESMQSAAPSKTSSCIFSALKKMVFRSA